jgi:hypothetical protein
MIEDLDFVAHADEPPGHDSFLKIITWEVQTHKANKNNFPERLHFLYPHF